MSVEQFYQIIQNFGSNNNDERSAAEHLYAEFLNSNGITAISYLIQIISNSQNQTDTLRCLLLVKDIFIRWPQIIISNPGFDSNMSQFLLSLLDNPSQLEVIQLNISSLISTAAKLYFQNSRWPSFPNDLLHRFTSQNPLTVSISLDSFILCVHSGILNVDLIAPFFDTLYQFVWQSNPSYLHILTIRLIFLLAKKGIACQCFSDFILKFPAFIVNLPPQIANSMLSDLTNYSDFLLPFFNDSFKNLFDAFMSVYVDPQHDKGTRELILEIIAEICQTNSNSMQVFIEPIFTAFMKVSCEISGPDFINEDYEDPTPRTTTEKSIERISQCFIETENFAEYIFGLFTILSQESSFEKVRASFVLLQKCLGLMIPFFRNGSACEFMVSKIISGMQNPNVFVQIAALQLLAKAERKLLPEFQRDFNSIFISPLLFFIKNNPTPYALKALYYIISGSEPEFIQDDLGQLYQLMISLVGKVPIPSQIHVLHCISSLIEKSGEQMEQYYQIVVSVLVSVIQTNELDLVLPAIQAFSMIGFSFPSEQFVTDSQKFIQLILTINRENFTDKQNDTINSALNAFVSVLGGDFQEQFVQLMITLIHVIEQPVLPNKLPLSTDRSTIMDEILIPNEIENQLYVYSRSQVSGIYRSLLTLDVFLLEVGAAILPIVPKLCEVFAKTISYFFDSMVQDETIQCLEAMMATLFENQFAEYSIMIPILQAVNENILNPIQDEDIILHFFDFLNLLTACHSTSIDSALIHLYLEICNKSLSRDYDEFIKTDLYLKIAKLLKFITQCPIDLQNSNQISSQLQQIGQQYYPLSEDAVSVSGIIVFWSGIIINLSQSPEQFNELLQFICKMMNYPDYEAQTNAFMAVSDILESPQFTADHMKFVLSVITETLSQFDGQDSELKESIDAAVFALTSIFMKYPDTTQDNSLVLLWFNLLPLKGKKAPCFIKVYDLLVQLITQNHGAVLQNMPHLLKVIAKAVKGANSSAQAKEAFKAIVRNIATNESTAAAFIEAESHLNNKCRDVIFQFLQPDQ
ncbi:hypothetical protein TRFO_05727 [Tritrichomonas foetus]|uniref:Importin N-terminal domain-containing protein n=1 Tax=Tritrichomonas foetus TaxID=1144522 RepID=A0A1J4K8N1_9EUKA|nr:hypothetical protein TRFO_05727 [Tritrichomonas foetus]|eukprot:OHT06068.1 hypothetical protein TRFO_05727 [Tritrichomonas foetus]